MAGAGFGAAAFGTMVERFMRTAALAQGPDYKALVCIFLFGGNDGNNTVIPYDNYNDPGGYADTRNASTLGIPYANLANSIIPTSIGNYALHPSLQRTDNGFAPIYDLWARGRLGVVANVGALVQPMTRAQYQSGAVPRPSQLFSHSDQQSENMNGFANSSSIATGWGGRILDKMYTTIPSFPPLVSVAGNQIFGQGARTNQLAVPDSNTAPQNILVINGFGTAADEVARKKAFNDLRGFDTGIQLVSATSSVMNTALLVSSALSTPITPDVAGFPNTTLGRQLKQVARLILLNRTQGALMLPRQIFFCSLGGFDTHQSQLANQGSVATAGLLAQVSQAMRALHDWLVNEARLPGGDHSANVTTFTLSDFSRTFQPSGSGGIVGTDHAWGNHDFVMGGALKGADIYGVPRDPTDPTTVFPTLLLGGPSDTDGGSNPRGRFIPTTGIEQYANTLAAWFGLPQDFPTLNQVFPNLCDAQGNTNFNQSLLTRSPFNLGFV
jgi:uncharacterized protein (DUF1501 family)